MESLKLDANCYWLGIQDHDLEVFDIVMETKYGTSYNSYLIQGDDKTALVDTVKGVYFEAYLEKVKSLVEIGKIDYIIVHHTEPDHAGSIEKLISLNPNIKVVATNVAIKYLREIVNLEFQAIAVRKGDVLDLGNKTLRFITAPNLHWPDTMYSYLEENKILFTCDSFGSHYAFDEVLISKLPSEKNEAYLDALLNYYVPIFSPFKSFVLKAISSLDGLNVKMVCPGHGPVLDTRIEEIIGTYQKWSTEPVIIEKSVIIPYTSAYGYTKEMAETIKMSIEEVDPSIIVKMYDLNVKNYEALKSELLSEIETANALIVGASTINKDAVAIVWDLLSQLSPVVHGGKIGGAFGSYGWSGEAPDYVHQRLSQLKFKVIDPVKLCFKPDDEKLIPVKEFGKEIANRVSLACGVK